MLMERLQNQEETAQKLAQEIIELHKTAA